MSEERYVFCKYCGRSSRIEPADKMGDVWRVFCPLDLLYIELYKNLDFVPSKAQICIGLLTESLTIIED